MELENSGKDVVTVRSAESMRNCLGQHASDPITGLHAPASAGIQMACHQQVQVSCEANTADTLQTFLTATGDRHAASECVIDKHAASESIIDKHSLVDESLQPASSVVISHDQPVCDTQTIIQEESDTRTALQGESDTRSSLQGESDTRTSLQKESERLCEADGKACEVIVCDQDSSQVNRDACGTADFLSQANKLVNEDGNIIKIGVGERENVDESNAGRQNGSAGDGHSLGHRLTSLDSDVICLDEDSNTKEGDLNSSVSRDIDCPPNEVKQTLEKRAGTVGENCPGNTRQNQIRSVLKSAVKTNDIEADDDVNVVYVDDETRQTEMKANRVRDHNSTDDEKENKRIKQSSTNVKEGSEEQTKQTGLTGKAGSVKDSDKQSDSADDEVEIIGETKVIHTSKPHRSVSSSQNVIFVPEGLPLLNHKNSVTVNHSRGASSIPASAVVANLAANNSTQRMPSLTPRSVTGGQSFASGGLPRPQSSLDQIELIRWEIQNRIYTRPIYFKPNPAAELGSLAKFLYGIGSDLIKEAVYHDLVKIQSRKKDSNKLNEKEKEDLSKLKDIEQDLFATIGHLKLKLKKRCNMCDFRTESVNVMFYHKQYPHEDHKGMHCSHCSFVTKQPVAFKSHMESQHRILPRLLDKKATHECELCSYENNQEQKVNLHKQRCIKQFRPGFNLHPSCLSGAEINMCLENIFYKMHVPSRLPPVQLKQAAIANLQKLQAKIKSITPPGTNNQLLRKNKSAVINVVQNGVGASGRMSQPVKVFRHQPSVLTNSAAVVVTKSPRPTIASMLNNKENPRPLAAIAPAPATVPAVGVFEVCEVCGGFVKDRKALRIHFFYAHRIDLPFNLFERNQAPLYCATCYVRFWTAQGLRKHIDSHKKGNQSQGIVGKCVLCSHHVLNLVLHMRMVHNRDLKHYVSTSTCMFCGVKSVTPQACEQHIVSVHGLVDAITGALIRPPSGAESLPKQQKPPHTSTPEQKSVRSSMAKGCICVLCKLTFSRNVDLTRHCMHVHHTCMKCGMVVADKPSLLKHVCLLSPGGIRNCSICGDTGYHPAYYIKHMRDKHLRKLSIKVARVSSQTIQRWTQRRQTVQLLAQPPTVLVEISDDDDDDTQKYHKSSSAATCETIADNGEVKKLEDDNTAHSGMDDDNSGATTVSKTADCDRGDDRSETAVINNIATECVEVLDTSRDLTNDLKEGRPSECAALSHKRTLQVNTPETSAKRQKTA